MLKKLQIAAIVLCMLSNAAAGTVSIGTASARGDLRVNDYQIKGNATLFDGSVVETGQASADLRMSKGTEITLSSSSRGTLYSDHLVLQQGQTQVAPSKSFQLQVNGMSVIANEAQSRGVVSLKEGNVVEVASLNGSFGVTNGHGVVLANVKPGHVMTFAMQAGAGPQEFYGVGLVTLENGTYYFTTDADVKYVLTCKDPHSYVGDKVVVSGTITGGNAQQGSNGGMLCVKSMDINGPGGGLSKGTKWLIAGILVGGGVAAAIALSNRNHNNPPASR